MALHVVDGAVIRCSACSLPSTLRVPPINASWNTTPAATILDHVPGVNIMPFGPCMSLTNPAVAAATTAAAGVLTPQPCTPCTFTPWSPGVTSDTLRGAPILNDTSTLQCALGGVISVAQAGQVTANVP
jgi:hypothetical protein